jgi:hypothetical protein
MKGIKYNIVLIPIKAGQLKNIEHAIISRIWYILGKFPNVISKLCLSFRDS